LIVNNLKYCEKEFDFEVQKTSAKKIVAALKKGGLTVNRFCLKIAKKYFR